MSKNTIVPDIHCLRLKIDEVIEGAKRRQEDIRNGNGKHEIEMVIDKLVEAKMWSGKVLEKQGSELPVQYQDKAKKSDCCRD